MNKTVTVRELKQSEQGGLFHVCTDDGFCFSLSAKGIFETGLAVGRTFTAEEFQSITAYAEEEHAYRRAVWLLGYRDYSRGELLKKLASEGANGEKAVARLEEAGYVNDAEYARKIATRYAESYGRFRLREEFEKRFLPSDVYEPLFEEFCSEDGEKVYRLLCARLRGKPFADAKEKQKTFAYFMRRGFTSEEIRHAFRKYGEEDFT